VKSKTRYTPQPTQIDTNALLQAMQPTQEELAVYEYARKGIEAFARGVVNDPYLERITAIERRLDAAGL
jgi:hypothetical protein